MVEDKYVKKAKQYEHEAHYEEMRGYRKSPRKIAESYEQAGDAWGNTKELPRAETAYYHALRNLRKEGTFRKDEIERIEKKLNDVKIQSKRLLHGFEKMKSGLEKKFGFLSITALLFALFLVSYNLTGNVLGSMSLNDTRWIGVCFFLCGIAFAFMYFKNKN
jgi:hypothetical protein